MASPALPTGEQYDDLVSYVACYGWGLGSALAHSVTRATFTRWRAHAAAGKEPYKAWCGRFAHDLTEARREIKAVTAQWVDN